MLNTISTAQKSQETVMDHRQGRRRRLLALVEIHWRDGQSAVGLAHDLSPDGMFIVSGLDPGMNKYIDIVLPVAGNIPIRFSGLVVHHNNHGFGLLFHQLDGEAHAFVEKYLS